MKYASMAKRSYLTMPPLIPNGVRIRCQSFTDSRATPRSRFFYLMVSFTALYVLSIPRAARSRRQRSSQHSATMRAAWRNLSAHDGGGRNAIERPLGFVSRHSTFRESNGRRSCAMPSCCEGAWACRTNRHWTYEALLPFNAMRSEEHTSELQSLMRISYSVFCL